MEATHGLPNSQQLSVGSPGSPVRVKPYLLGGYVRLAKRRWNGQIRLRLRYCVLTTQSLHLFRRSEQDELFGQLLVRIPISEISALDAAEGSAGGSGEAAPGYLATQPPPGSQEVLQALGRSWGSQAIRLHLRGKNRPVVLQCVNPNEAATWRQALWEVVLHPVDPGDTLGTPDRSGVSADSSELLSIAANSSNSSAAPASAPRKLRRRLWKQERAGDGQMEIPELPFGSVGARPPHAGSGSWGDSDGSNPLVNEDGFYSDDSGSDDPPEHAGAPGYLHHHQGNGSGLPGFEKTPSKLSMPGATPPPPLLIRSTSQPQIQKLPAPALQSRQSQLHQQHQQFGDHHLSSYLSSLSYPDLVMVSVLEPSAPSPHTSTAASISGLLLDEVDAGSNGRATAFETASAATRASLLGVPRPGTAQHTLQIFTRNRHVPGGSSPGGRSGFELQSPSSSAPVSPLCDTVLYRNLPWGVPFVLDVPETSATQDSQLIFTLSSGDLAVLRLSELEKHSEGRKMIPVVGGPEHLAVRWERHLEAATPISKGRLLQKISVLVLIVLLVASLMARTALGPHDGLQLDQTLPVSAQTRLNIGWLLVCVLVWFLARLTGGSYSLKRPGKGSPGTEAPSSSSSSSTASSSTTAAAASPSGPGVFQRALHAVWGRSGRIRVVRYILQAELVLDSWRALPSTAFQQHQQQQFATPGGRTKLERSSHQQQQSSPMSSSASAAGSVAAATSEKEGVAQLRPETWGLWGPADSTCLHVRGPTYLRDHKKIDADPFAFDLVGTEVWHSDAPGFKGHVCARPQGFAHKLFARIRAQQLQHQGSSRDHSDQSASSASPGRRTGLFGRGQKHPETASSASSSSREKPESAAAAEYEQIGPQRSSLPLLFAVCFYVPAQPSFYVQFFFLQRPGIRYPPQFHRIMERFLAGDDKYRNQRFKFIPRVVEGSWVVRRGVGTTPAILGNKLRQTSYRVCTEQLNYLEVNVDVGSSSLGSNIFRLVKGYCRQLVMDLCFLVEAQADDELPEVLLGGVRMANVILSQTQPHPALQG